MRPPSPSTWLPSRRAGLTERGFSPPQATPFSTAVVRRLWALARSPARLPLSPAGGSILLQDILHLTNLQYCFAPFPGQSFPGVKAVTPFWTGCAPLLAGIV